MRAYLHTETMKMGSLRCYDVFGVRTAPRSSVIGAFKPDAEFGRGVGTHTRLLPSRSGALPVR